MKPVPHGKDCAILRAVNRTFLLAALSVAMLCGCLKGGATVTAITFDFSEDDVQALPDNLAQIPAAAPPVLPDAGPTVSEHGYLRAYANTEQNSRCVARLPAGTWRVEWHADLRPQFPPAFVLHDTGNILVLAGTWQLFSSTGQRIQMALGGAGMGALDPANRLFYMVSREGYIGAYDIATGKEHFAWLPVFGDEYNRVLIARRGQTVVSVGIERQLDPHRHHLANSAVVESLELPNPLRVDEMGLVSITDETRKLHLESSQCVAAMHEGMIACAVPGRLVLLDSNFKVHGALKAEFTPISLSMDEDWRLYLVVEKHSAENHSAESEKGAALWAVNERGERWLDLKLPRDFNPTRYPPIIGYDHRIVQIGRASCRERV